MRTIIKLWKNNYAKLGQINLECPSGNEIIRSTMRPSAYKGQAEEIIKRIDIRDSILEIGCGFGGLASEVLKLMSVRYTVVDNKIMLAQAKRFLGDTVEYIDAEKIEMLQGRKFGLFISHYCLSETPPEYREYVLKEITKNCQGIFIIDLDDTIKPTPKMLECGYVMIPMNIEKWLEKYFIIEKTKCRHNRAIYRGERKKR